MTKFQVGDKVRLSVEGEIEDIGGVYNNVQIGSRIYNLDHCDLEVLERRKPKVGDSVTRTEARRLPPGSVINHNGRLVFVGVDKMLIGRGNDLLDPALDHLPVTYTVAYLPD